MLDADCHFSTLKARLGLPRKILDTLPEEEDVIKTAYTFEKDHPQLFSGEPVGQLGVYFSYETRNHTCFGTLSKGYAKDYADTLKLLFRAGISAHTVFQFPEDPKQYPLILGPSPASMTENEIAALKCYAQKGGRVVITGPSAYPGCRHSWKLPTHPECEPMDFFHTVRDGVWSHPPRWMTETDVPHSGNPDVWTQIGENILYNPCRVESVKEAVLEYCRKWAKPLPVTITSQEGYLITVFQGNDGITVQMLAENYDTDIDHHLDQIRYHRSRVNYINKVEPIGISRQVILGADKAPQVYTPFNTEATQISMEKDVCTLTLPEKCAYAIFHFPK